MFRTLELVTPSFWLRHLHVRLTGEAPPPAPQMLHLRLWPSLPLPPVQRIDGARPDVPVDVIIETEHAVWALIDAATLDAASADTRIAHVSDALAWLAGARHQCCGVIERETDGRSLGATLARRYARSGQSATLRSATRGPTAPTTTRCGVTTWAGLAAILADCHAADHLSSIERALAGHAVEWLSLAGVEPDILSG